MPRQLDISMVAAAAAGIMHSLLNTEGFDAWWLGLSDVGRGTVCDEYGGFTGLYEVVASAAYALEAGLPDGTEWGEDWDFYLTCDAIAADMRESHGVPTVLEIPKLLVPLNLTAL